jgi:uncharacterized protein (DUF58 family)
VRRSLERSWVLLLILLLSILGAVTVGDPIFFNLAYMAGGILGLSLVWAWLNVHWVKVTRQVKTGHVQVGGFVEERLVVENTGPLPKLWLELKDHSSLPLHRAGWVVSGLRGKRQQSWPVRTPCYKRGRYLLGPVSLISSDPFGLFRLTKYLPQNFSFPLVVYPLVVDLPGFQPPVGELVGGQALRRRTHYVTTNVSGLREYAFGDSFNRIHWPSTARTGQMMVKEFELDPTADVWIFLDMEKRVQAGLSYPELPLPVLPEVYWERLPKAELPPSTEEYGVVIAASLARHFIRQSRSVGLMTYPDMHHREIAMSDRGERQLTRIYEMLAVVQANGSLPLADMLAAETMRLSRNTTVIIVTPATDLHWVAAARNLNTRGIKVTAVLIDPGSFGMPFNSLNAEIELTASHVPHYIVHHGDALETALANVKKREK